MLKQISGVLLDLNDTERMAFKLVLELAERHLDEAGRLPKGDGRYESKQTTKAMAKAVIDALREELDLYSAEDAEPERDVEQWRRERAVKADHHHTNKQWVLCAYARCNMRLQRANGVKAEHPWVRARQEGWTPIDWQYYGEGGYSEALGHPSEDLVCPTKHDKHGCPLFNGPEDCQLS